MKQTKRILSLVLCLLMLVAVVPVTSYATESRSDYFNKNYTLNGNGPDDMLAIAQAQLGSNPGYSEAWCADFVADCAKLAGQSSAIAKNGAVSSMRNQVLDSGGVVVSSRQKGDLVFYYCSSCGRYVHVGIVLDGTYSIEGNFSRKVSKVSNTYADSEGHKVTTGTISRSYIRPNYNHALAPTWATLSIDKENVRAEQEFTLSMNCDTAVSYYWLTICRASNNEMVLSESTNGSFTTSFLSCDHYYAWCSAANSKGSVDSNRVDFYVYGDPPTQANNYVDKSIVKLGDSLTVTTNANTYYARIYTSIYCNDEPYESAYHEWQYTFTPNKAGVYGINTSAFTIDGTAHAGWSTTTVIDPAVFAREYGTDFDAFIVNPNSGKLLENNATNVELSGIAKADRDAKTIWHFEKQSDNSYRIQSVCDGTYLDAESYGTDDGTNIHTYQKNETDSRAQKWYIGKVADGYVLKAFYTDMVADISGGSTAAGANVQLYTSNLSSAQRFTIEKIDNDNPPIDPTHTHSYVVAVTKAATCSATGIKTFTCSCGDSYTETIPINASNHVNTTNVAATASTCTVKGYTAGVYCNDCKQYISGHAEQPLAAHTLTTVNQREATCTAEGYTGDQVCTTCNQTITSGTAIAKKAHTLTTVNQKAATCTAEGYTGDQVCTVCNQTITKGNAINALGHANADSNGNCTRCGTHIKDVTPSNPQPQPNPNACKYCGQVHSGPFGWLIKFFHSILAIFKR